MLNSKGKSMENPILLQTSRPSIICGRGLKIVCELSNKPPTLLYYRGHPSGSMLVEKEKCGLRARMSCGGGLRGLISAPLTPHTQQLLTTIQPHHNAISAVKCNSAIAPARGGADQRRHALLLAGVLVLISPPPPHDERAAFFSRIALSLSPPSLALSLLNDALLHFSPTHFFFDEFPVLLHSVGRAHPSFCVCN